MVVTTTAPYIKRGQWYDRMDELTCCVGRSEQLFRSEQTISVGSVSFEVDLTTLMNLILPSGFALDGAVLKLNGSSSKVSFAHNPIFKMCRQSPMM